jgi:hypothetical protein
LIVAAAAVVSLNVEKVTQPITISGMNNVILMEYGENDAIRRKIIVAITVEMRSKMQLEKITDYIKAHRELWDWCARNPKKHKSNWPGFSKNGGPYQFVRSFCFACQYTEDNGYAIKGTTMLECGYCLFEWPFADGASVPCTNAMAVVVGLYKQWIKCSNNKMRTKIAKQIRDLPINPIWRDQCTDKTPISGK